MKDKTLWCLVGGVVIIGILIWAWSETQPDDDTVTLPANSNSGIVVNQNELAIVSIVGIAAVAMFAFWNHKN